MIKLSFFCDKQRHLICVPYTAANLHEMARQLGIKRCWFHNTPDFPHYDIPLRRRAEIMAKCQVVNSKKIIEIIKQGKENEKTI